MTTYEVIASERLYIIKRAKISCWTHITFFACSFVLPIVYFKSRNDVSIPHLRAYSCFIFSNEYSFLSKLVSTVS